MLTCSGVCLFGLNVCFDGMLYVIDTTTDLFDANRAVGSQQPNGYTFRYEFNTSGSYQSRFCLYQSMNCETPASIEVVGS